MSDREKNNIARRLIHKRLRRLENRERSYTTYSQRISVCRSLLFVLFLVVVWFGNTSEFSEGNKLIWLVNFISIVLIAGFLYFVFRHNKIEKALSDLRSQKSHAKIDDCRIELEWHKIPRKRQVCEFENEVANDLNIIGDGSLIHLIDTTSSVEARNVLLKQLISPDLNIENVRWRQKCVRSLVEKPVLFSKLRLAGGKAGESVFSGDTVLDLLESCEYPKWGRLLLLFTLGLAIVNVILLIAFGVKVFFLPFILYVVIFFSFNLHANVKYSRIVGVSSEIERLETMLHVLENRVDSSDPILSELLAPLRGPNSPSHLTRQLNKSASALSVRSFALAHVAINAFFPWDQYHVYRLEATRQQLMENFEVWLDTVAKTDAYCALAHFARLNPHYCLPELIPSNKLQEKSFSAVDLGHPLLHHRERIVNDFGLNDTNRIAIVSGSNMSGKSAFLRTVGINVCLAQAGSVVCASRYRSSLFRVVSCIDITDDMESGKSLFYREIEKLKAILESVDNKAHDTLFLIDEILKGTNNQERIVGGSQYLQSLSDRSGFGLVSTHDLEFANLADKIDTMFNIHFTDAIVDDKMVFDRKLKSGRSSTTNALRIMELEGLI